MSGKKYDDDIEYNELVTEYERYIKMTPGAYEDFDEWLELEYGSSRSKVKQPSPKRARRSKYEDGDF